MREEREKRNARKTDKKLRHRCHKVKKVWDQFAATFRQINVGINDFKYVISHRFIVFGLNRK